MARWMWIVAGPNGAGKSSFAGDFLINLGHRSLIKLNADERTLELRKAFPDAARNDLNLQAAIAVTQAVSRETPAIRYQPDPSPLLPPALTLPPFRAFSPAPQCLDTG